MSNISCLLCPCTRTKQGPNPVWSRGWWHWELLGACGGSGRVGQQQEKQQEMGTGCAVSQPRPHTSSQTCPPLSPAPGFPFLPTRVTHLEEMQVEMVLPLLPHLRSSLAALS